MSNMDAALEYASRGWSIIPIIAGSKRPHVKWSDFISRIATEDEIERWWKTWPDAGIGLVAGEFSGILILDCDNEEALEYAAKGGMTTPVKVKTPNGWHLYFKHPADGFIRGPKVGGSAHNWPDVKGLDFRGDKSYAVMPPTKGYEFRFDDGADFQDLPVWHDWQASTLVASEIEFSDLDLSTTRASGDGLQSERSDQWRETGRVAAKFPSGRIPSGQGNARNNRVASYVGEIVAKGVSGDDLRTFANAFMDRHFEDRLTEREMVAMFASVTHADKVNHPGRAEKMAGTMTIGDMRPTASTITFADRHKIREKAESEIYLIQPWLKKASLVQVFGYSGHGKSIFILHMMTALACAKPFAGPFAVEHRGKVLIMDYENGLLSLSRRLDDLAKVYGDPGEFLQIWVMAAETDFEREMNIENDDGRTEFEDLVNSVAPDVIVIDTVRSALPDQDENAKDGWTLLNRFVMRLRRLGYAIVMLHHANKASADSKFQSYAGSSHQKTYLDRQIQVRLVHKTEEEATRMGGVKDKKMELWKLLPCNLPSPDYNLATIIHISYYKFRDRLDDDDVDQWIGIAKNMKERGGANVIVSSRSSRQKAMSMALDGYGSLDIIDTVNKSIEAIEDWIGTS